MTTPKIPAPPPCQYPADKHTAYMVRVAGRWYCALHARQAIRQLILRRELAQGPIDPSKLH